MMTEFIHVQGHTLRANLQPGHGIPLVICNGWGANIEVLDPLMDCLGNRPILRFDVPGIGGSPLPRMPLRMPRLAQLVEQLWQEMGMTQVDVLGYSWGGALAQELARRNPKAVRRLVLAATSPGHTMVPAWPNILTAFADTAWLGVPLKPSRLFERKLLSRVGGRLFGGDVLRRNPLAILPGIRQLEKPSAAAMLWQLAALFGWSSLPWLSKLPQPTLILAGKQDRVINPLNALILKRLIPDTRLQWIDGGHLFPVLDAPELTAEALESFLDAHPKVVPLAGRRKQPARRAS